MSEHPVKRRKKLIEVAIPLEAINAASAREKSIRHGHPSTLHLWWSRKPLAASRAVLFAQTVDDPSAIPEQFPTENAQNKERRRLLELAGKLSEWENTNNLKLLEEAKKEIQESWKRFCEDNKKIVCTGDNDSIENLIPGFHDPFAGGGSLPFEAQRLGFDSLASDLNPVSILINQAIIELPYRFRDIPPVNKVDAEQNMLLTSNWKGAQGMAKDLEYYSQWMLDQARSRIGGSYPAKLIKEETAFHPGAERRDLEQYIGRSLNPIAYIWYRTVRSPSPSFSSKYVPLTSTFVLAMKPEKEKWVEPVIEDGDYSLVVRSGAPMHQESVRNGTRSKKAAHFKCILSGDPITPSYIKEEAASGRLKARLVAIVCEGDRERVYLTPDPEDMEAADDVRSNWKPDIEFFKDALGFRIGNYGMSKWSDIFTERQNLALCTFAGLVSEARERVLDDAKRVIGVDDSRTYDEGGMGPQAYADAIATYLGLAIGRSADFWCSLATWSPQPKNELVSHVFTLQALPMTWNFGEVNPFSDSGGGFAKNVSFIVKFLSHLNPNAKGIATQADAAVQSLSKDRIISTDPPYYNNVGYSDLSDFFYVWLRRSLRGIRTTLFKTLVVPKNDEIVILPQRQGGRKAADKHFLDRMTMAMNRIATQSHPGYPVTIYYAFKQSETDSGEGTASTGWEIFLESVIRAGFQITGTWPIKTEREARTRSIGSNALSSSIVLVCRQHLAIPPIQARSTFRAQLRSALSLSIRELTNSGLSPVDITQAAIGPGMAVFSSYKAVANPDDSSMSVREALIEINSALDEILAESDSELDPESKFAVAFFESHGYSEQPYGEAEKLAVALNISVDGVVKAGILSSIAGKVRLLQRSQLPTVWDPWFDKRLCVWEATQQLIKRLEAAGETSAATLLVQLKEISTHGDLAANCRALAYRLYNHCEKTKQAEDARSYNGLVIAWPELERQASAASSAQTVPLQTSLI